MYIEIYADILFLVTLVSEGISMWLLAVWRGEKIRWNRLLQGSAVIAMVGVVSEILFRTGGSGWSWLIDGGIRLLIYRMVYGVQGYRGLFGCYLGQKLIYVWLGGLQYLVWRQEIVSLHGVLFFLLTGGGILYMVLRVRQRKERWEAMLYTVEISRNEFQCICTALLDTGNQLYYRDQQPVILITSQVAEKLGVHGLSVGMDYRIIPYRSVGCEGGILHGFVCDRIVIRERKMGNGKVFCREHVVAGVTEHPLSGEGQYQMLLHPALIQEE